MNFQDFILIAEGKKKQLKSMLSYAYNLGQQQSPTETVRILRPEPMDVKSIQQTTGRKSVANYWEQQRKEAEKRKKKAVKALMKSHLKNKN